MPKCTLCYIWGLVWGVGGRGRGCTEGIETYSSTLIFQMQMRFDGNIGFPGGLRDDVEEAPEDVLNREMQEEINLDLTKYSFSRKHHAMSHLNEKKRMVTHFFTMEVTEEQYEEIERNVLTAKEYGIEVTWVDLL